MNKITLLILFLGWSAFTNAQADFNIENGQFLDSLPNIEGKLTGYSAHNHQDVFIQYTILSPDFRGFVQKTAAIHEDGSFKLTLDHKYPYQKVLFKISDIYAGAIISNHDLKIIIDLKALEGKYDQFENKAIQFEGSDAELNSFYNAYLDFKVDKKNEFKGLKYSTIMNRTSQKEYKVKQIRSLYDDLIKIEKQFLKKHDRSYAWILENERSTEMYADFAYVYVGKTMKDDLWAEITGHIPAVISENSIRYYSMLALKLLSHEEKEIRSLSRIIYNGDSSDPEDKKNVDRFLAEQDKKKAGLAYDTEVYAEGLEIYIRKYDELVEKAKLDLFISKLNNLPENKKGLVAIKGQPLDLPDRTKYLTNIVPVLASDWQKKLAMNELEIFKARVDDISEDVRNAVASTTEPELGKFLEHMNTGARVWISTAQSVPELLGQIKSFYAEKDIMIYIYGIPDAKSVLMN
ncbi:hypothetical protein [Portibacter marinus]|uniref:hypothetical protein n=1 Tax=Portibacter marinus TaxID=2898660 RepID=UPI001F1ECCDB|nr:hypothetical protein [Portibacter marinus]